MRIVISHGFAYKFKASCWFCKLLENVVCLLKLLSGVDLPYFESVSSNFYCSV